MTNNNDHVQLKEQPGDMDNSPKMNNPKTTTSPSGRMVKALFGNASFSTVTRISAVLMFPAIAVIMSTCGGGGGGGGGGGTPASTTTASPTFSINDPTDLGKRSITSQNFKNYRITGTCIKNGQPVAVKLMDDASPDVSTDAKTNNCTGSKWDTTADATSLKNGKVRITATHNGDSKILDVTKDTTTVGVPGTIILDKTQSGNIVPDNVKAYSVSAECPDHGGGNPVPNGILNVRITDSAQKSIESGTPCVSTRINHSVTQDASSLADGTVDIEVFISIKNTGNHSVINSPKKIKLIPAAPITSSLPDITFKGNNPNITKYSITGTCNLTGHVGRDETVDVILSDTTADTPSDTNKWRTIQTKCTDGNWKVTDADVTKMNQSGKVFVRTKYRITVKDADNNNLTVTSSSAFLKEAANDFICPLRYIGVPPLTGYTTSSFCVMKYEAKAKANDAIETDGKVTNVGDPWKPDSTPDGLPWHGITRDQAISRCAAVDAKHALITNSEWQTLARNIAGVAVNWREKTGGAQSSGVGVGCLKQGNNENADGCGYDGPNPEANSTNSRAMHTLSNGEEIWNLAGNAAEFVQDNAGVLTGITEVQISALSESNNTTTFTVGGNNSVARTIRGHFGPATYPTGTANINNNFFGFGTANIVNGQAALMRGYYSGGQNKTGIFAARTETINYSGGAGFRCAYHP